MGCGMRMEEWEVVDVKERFDQGRLPATVLLKHLRECESCKEKILREVGAFSRMVRWLESAEDAGRICKPFRSVLFELYAYGAVDSVRGEELREHVENCIFCRDRAPDVASWLGIGKEVAEQTGRAA